MKLQITTILILAALFISCNNGNAESNKKASVTEQIAEEGTVVYYFHYSRRCATCTAVEDVTVKAIDENYGDKVIFKSLNLDEPEVEELANSMKVSGQTLLIMKGEERFNLTNEAFMYARKSPEKLVAQLKTTLDPLM